MDDKGWEEQMGRHKGPKRKGEQGGKGGGEGGIVQRE